ncbi:hypothetical protein FIBSPDRAFT_947824 [Athelia psychrophila]|uniref:Uncharacterized protein n=1 Tax=Athelia psychrophila TaxID=1759441 RepID=A0A166RG99_9AGAM|nr:hypothetical protein FIBSPDRAFT_947824 [Fibularhizoctonia sp. CBS 109695]
MASAKPPRHAASFQVTARSPQDHAPRRPGTRMTGWGYTKVRKTNLLLHGARKRTPGAAPAAPVDAALVNASNGCDPAQPLHSHSRCPHFLRASSRGLHPTALATALPASEAPQRLSSRARRFRRPTRAAEPSAAPTHFAALVPPCACIPTCRRRGNCCPLRKHNDATQPIHHIPPGAPLSRLAKSPSAYYIALMRYYALLHRRYRNRRRAQPAPAMHISPELATYAHVPPAASNRAHVTLQRARQQSASAS